MASTTEDEDSPSKHRLDDSLLGFWKTKESSISTTSGAASVDSAISSARSSSNYRNNKSQEAAAADGRGCRYLGRFATEQQQQQQFSAGPR